MLRFTSSKLQTHHKNHSARIFAWLSLICGIGSAVFWTIFPLILHGKIHSESIVGYYFSFIALIGLIVSILSTLLFQRYSRIHITKVVFIISILALFFMTFAKNMWQIVGLDIPRAIAEVLIWMSLSLFVHEYSKKANIALEEGRYYLFNNIGWIIGPLIGGYSAKFFGNESIFIVSTFFFLVALLVFLHQGFVVKHPHIQNGIHTEGIRELWDNMKTFLQRVELRKVFFVSLGLTFWWKLRGVYMPLTIENMGYSQDVVGWVMSMGILPLVLLEQYAGRLAQRNGVRTYIILGFTLVAAFVLSFIFASPWPILLFVLFASADIGAAFLEPLRITYFFEVVKKKEAERFFGLYNTAETLGHIMAPLLGGFFLFVGQGNIQYLWGGFFLLFVLFAFGSRTIKKKY